MAKANRKTINEAKRLGIRLTTGNGSKRVAKNEKTLANQIKNALKRTNKKTSSKKIKSSSSKKKKAPIKKYAKSTVHGVARMLGQKGGRKAARNRRKK